MLYETLRNYDIILGSGSPRRRYLLEEMGLKFRVLVNNSLEEIWPEGLLEKEIPVYLAELKADHILEEVSQDQLLITADTIVWMGGEVINKPVDPEDAFRMLRQLSGNRHEVFTGVCFRIRKQKTFFLCFIPGMVCRTLRIMKSIIILIILNPLIKPGHMESRIGLVI